MATAGFHGFIAITRLERSVLSELLEAFGLAVASLTLIMMLHLASAAVLDGLPIGTLLRFLPLMAPYTLPWTIPTAFVAACIMVFSRMAGNNELTAIRASGLHVWRVLTPAALAAVMLVTICGFLNHHVVPKASFFQYKVVKAASASEYVAAIRALSEPMMTVKSRSGRYTIYVGDVEGENLLRDIVIVLPEKALGTAGGAGEHLQITYVKAPMARYEYSDERGEIIFYLEGDPAAATAGDPNAGKVLSCKSVFGTTPRDFERGYCSRCILSIDVGGEADVQFVPRKAKHLTTAQLMLKIEAVEKEIRAAGHGRQGAVGMTDEQKAFEEKIWRDRRADLLTWRTDVHKRAALSLAPLLLGAIAVPLGVMIRRGHRLVAYGLAVGIILLYYAMMAGAWKMGEAGTAPPPVAVWSVTGVLAVVGCTLFRNMVKR